jgi:hypothetical protein
LVLDRSRSHVAWSLTSKHATGTMKVCFARVRSIPCGRGRPAADFNLARVCRFSTTTGGRPLP